MLVVRVEADNGGLPVDAPGTKLQRIRGSVLDDRVPRQEEKAEVSELAGGHELRVRHDDGWVHVLGDRLQELRGNRPEELRHAQYLRGVQLHAEVPRGALRGAAHDALADPVLLFGEICHDFLPHLDSQHLHLARCPRQHEAPIVRAFHAQQLVLVEAPSGRQLVDDLVICVDNVGLPADDQDRRGPRRLLLQREVSRLVGLPTGVEVEQMQQPRGGPVPEEGPIHQGDLGAALLDGPDGVVLEVRALPGELLDACDEGLPGDLNREAERLCADRHGMPVCCSHHRQLAEGVDGDLILLDEGLAFVSRGRPSDNDHQARVLATLDGQGLPRHVAALGGLTQQRLDELHLGAAEDVQVREALPEGDALRDDLVLHERRNLVADAEEPRQRLPENLLPEDHADRHRCEDLDAGAFRLRGAQQRAAPEALPGLELGKLPPALAECHKDPLLDDVERRRVDAVVDDDLSGHVDLPLAVAGKL
mmetsp:Transcript_112489/g.281785  ORF Transcript_112489/g.281785 Transcript_112489/m.281785 type:complete len:478 (+) Transcript_112489:1798-3231(+)